MNPIVTLKDTFFKIIERQPVTPLFLVAYSGGLDSTVLLHLMSCYCQQYNRTVKAIHVNHRLEKDSTLWEAYCQKECQKLAIPFCSYSVDLPMPKGKSTEAWAREQRYEILAKQMQENSILLTAHHQDDQAETVLLQLLRGAGPQGLASMPTKKAFAQGHLLRPLLAFSRAELLDYANQHGLNWIEDPSNQCTDYNRNFLRHDILPQLKTHWPSLSKTLHRSATNIAVMNQVVSSYIKKEIKSIQLNDPLILNIELLSQRAADIQSLVIRQWLKERNFDTPTHAHMNRIQKDIIQSGGNTQAEVCFGNTVIRKFRKGLFATRAFAMTKKNTTLWDLQNTFETSLGALSATERKGFGIKKDLMPAAGVEVRYRLGGEKIRRQGCDHHSELKKLMLEAGILPWYRSLLPLIYINGQFACVPGFWLSDDFAARENEEALCIEWQHDMSFLTPAV